MGRGGGDEFWSVAPLTQSAVLTLLGSRIDDVQSPRDIQSQPLAGTFMARGCHSYACGARGIGSGTTSGRVHYVVGDSESLLVCTWRKSSLLWSLDSMDRNSLELDAQFRQGQRRDCA